MSDQDEFKDRIAQIHAEFDQFRAAIMEVAQTVCDYREQLKKSRLFTRQEQFMLAMEYQTMVLQAILMGNMGGPGAGPGDEPEDLPEVPDYPPED